MKRWKTVRAGTAVLERIARCLGSGTDLATANDAVRGHGAARKARRRAKGGSEIRGFGNDGNGADKSGGRGAGRRPDGAGAAGPAAVTEGRPYGPGDCGHHIMLPCAARRAVLGRGAALSAPGDAYSCNGGRGLPGTGAHRRRDGDGRVGARVR